MPALSKVIVKSWFVTAAKPFWHQFAAWIDACWFKGELIPITDIDGIDVYFGQLVPPVDINFTADHTYTIPAGYAIYQIYATSYNANANLKIGTAAGLDDIMAESKFISGKLTPITINIPAEVATEIFISGVSSASRFRIYLHKI